MFSSVAGLYHRVLGAAVHAIDRTGVHPNVLTIMSIFPAIIAGFAAAFGQFPLAAILLLISGIFDLLDGALARAAHKESRFGALLDSTLDRLSDAAVLMGMAYFYAPHGSAVLLPIAAILTSYTISYIRARAEGLAIDLPRLWMRREDRLAILVVGLLLAPISLDLPLIFVGILALGGAAAATAALLAAVKRS